MEDPTETAVERRADECSPLSYLQPPPNMSPVVVVKDFGGYVNAYASQTEIYRQTNREVRIHECHSACTMALSLPNVCVYPNSVFKFHQAYDPRNHVTNWQVSDELFHTYPEAVRDRLGTLTRSFTILRGSELIDLGVRNCEEPQPRIMVAQAVIKPLPESTRTGGSTLSMLTGKLQGMIPGFGAKPEAAPPTPGQRPRRPPQVPDGMLEPTIPLPPQRPVTLAVAEPDAPDASMPAVPEPTAPVTITSATKGDIPLPPPRPKILMVAYTPSLPPIPFMKTIGGSQPILPARFVPFPKRAT